MVMSGFAIRATLLSWLMIAGVGLAGAQDAAPQRPAPIAAMPAGRSAEVTQRLLSGLSRTTQSVSFATSKGPFTGTFEGVLLWELLKKAGLGFKDGGALPDLGQSVVVIGRDGYAVAVSMGEIAPDYGNRPILIADRVDGRALLPQDGFRLVAPGDARGGRSVRDVVAIEPR